MKTKLVTVVHILARLFSQLPVTAFATPTPTQGVVPIPGSALHMTIWTVNDGLGGQSDLHVSSDRVSDTDGLFYDILFQNLVPWILFLIWLNHTRAIGRID